MTTNLPPRLFLSPPHIGSEELRYIDGAFKSNYIAPLGPMVEAFEYEFSKYIGIRHCLALASGTAAMHLALCELQVKPGDQVLASTLTFIGSVNPAIYLGAQVSFIDCDINTWNMDPRLLAVELAEREKTGSLPKVVIPTDLYGQCADLPALKAVCEPYGIPIVVDSAEAVGSFYRDPASATPPSALRPPPSEVSQLSTLNSPLTPHSESSQPPLGRASSPSAPLSGTLVSDLSTLNSPTPTDAPPTDAPTHRRTSASPSPTLNSQLSTLNSPAWSHAGAGSKAAVYSFNGNKIITTSGGGMLASDDIDLIAHARKLSQQGARPRAPLRAYRNWLQLPDEQRPRRDWPRPVGSPE